MLFLPGAYSSSYNDRLNLLQRYNYDEMLELMDDDAESRDDHRLKNFLRQSSELIRMDAIRRYIYCNWESVSCISIFFYLYSCISIFFYLYFYKLALTPS